MSNSTELPTLLLGTAMWGWTIPRSTCFSLLDVFYQSGFREVDTAVNYPINQRPEDFRAAEGILAEWIRVHGIKDLKVTMKVGSLNNLRTPEHNLSKSFLLMNLEDYRHRFGSNLDTFMIHWDNRSEEAEIRETMEALIKVRDFALRVGLSGIRFPDIYAQINSAPDFGFDFRIQIKHNWMQSDYGRYLKFHGRRCFVAYGIMGGGLKIEQGAYSETSTWRVRGGDPGREPDAALRLRLWKESNPDAPGLPELAMLFSAYSPDMEGILIGPSSVEQLGESIGVYRRLGDTINHKWYGAMISLMPKL
jgi:aryl-alcohol dehydrogenase-like predicted oxidoreductase